VSTPLRLTAQVRDGIAIFGTGAVQAVSFPIMGAGAPSAVAQTSVTKMLSGAGIASEAMDLEHFISA
jgi:cyanophycinase-like exopeptidase